MAAEQTHPISRKELSDLLARTKLNTILSVMYENGNGPSHYIGFFVTMDEDVAQLSSYFISQGLRMPYEHHMTRIPIHEIEGVGVHADGKQLQHYYIPPSKNTISRRKKPQVESTRNLYK